MPGPNIRVWGARSRHEIRQAMISRHQLFCMGLCGEILQDCLLAADQPHEDDENSLFHQGSYAGNPIAVGRLITDNLPTWRIWPRIPGKLPPVTRDRYFESSRVGLLMQYQNTVIGAHVLLELIGAQVTKAVELGCPDYLLTIRMPLFGFFHWLPWNLGDPFYYPVEEGGPATDKPEPVWPATLNLHELAAAAMWFKPEAYPIMFPGGTPWLDERQIRKGGQVRLDMLIKRNQRNFQGYIKKWRANPGILQHLQPRADAG
jgi:hypothetical protein